jgi:hypothetical protein
MKADKDMLDRFFNIKKELGGRIIEVNKTQHKYKFTYDNQVCVINGKQFAKSNVSEFEKLGRFIKNNIITQDKLVTYDIMCWAGQLIMGQENEQDENIVENGVFRFPSWECVITADMERKCEVFKQMGIECTKQEMIDMHYEVYDMIGMPVDEVIDEE